MNARYALSVFMRSWVFMGFGLDFQDTPSSHSRSFGFCCMHNV